MLIKLRPRLDQQGFTLVEVVVATTILGTVIGAIAAALIVGLKTTDQTAVRLSESRDAQLASAYLANDVQSARGLLSSPCGGSEALITFHESDSNGSSSYRYEPSAGGNVLVRVYCDAAGTVLDTTRLASFVGNATPSVTCDEAACGSSVPDRVEISIVEASGYTFTLKGVRRPRAPGATPAGGLPGSAIVSLGGGSDKHLRIEGNNELHIKGDLLIDCCRNGAPAPETVALVGDKSRLVIDGRFGIYKYPTVGGCTGCVEGKVSIGEPSIPSQPWIPESIDFRMPDPLRALPYPDENDVIARYGGPFNDGAYHGPGVYRTEPLVIRSDTVLASGIYILERGLTVEGPDPQVSSGPGGVFLFNGCGLNAPSSCKIDTDDTCDSDGATIVFRRGMSAVEPMATGPYRRVLIFQHRQNPCTILFEGRASLVSAEGVIYAPAPRNGITLGSGGSTLTAKGALATSILLTGGGNTKGVVTLG